MEQPVEYTSETLYRAYRSMKLIREFEERIRAEYQLGNLPGFIHVYRGQEAIAVGVCMHLGDEDYIASTHRGHGHCIAKGCDIEDMLLELACKQDGICKGKGGSMHIADVDKGMLGANGIVGAGPPIAVGAAVACKLRKDGSVSVSFGGDGATNQGTVFEAMNMAVVLKVPKVFVIENNGYSEHTGASYGIGADVVRRTEGFGIPVFQADGFDFFSVHEAARQAIEHARAGKGPSAVYAVATRYFGHFEGDPQNYRAKGEVERFRAESDCMMGFRRKVLEASLLDGAELDRIDAEVASLIDEAVQTARAAAPPPASAVYDDVYISY
jgi:pyruvate dehydrogenase E1 component alpha subunit